MYYSFICTTIVKDKLRLYFYMYCIAQLYTTIVRECYRTTAMWIVSLIYVIILQRKATNYVLCCSLVYDCKGKATTHCYMNYITPLYIMIATTKYCYMHREAHLYTTNAKGKAMNVLYYSFIYYERK